MMLVMLPNWQKTGFHPLDGARWIRDQDHGLGDRHDLPRLNWRNVSASTYAASGGIGQQPNLGLSAWESVPSGPVTWPDLRGGVSASDRGRPLVTGVNGPALDITSAGDPMPNLRFSWRRDSVPVLPRPLPRTR